LISAVLLLFRQQWRTSINRSAEAMTIFAVMCAGLFPLIHMGRPWDAFFIFPYPNQRGPLWINFPVAAGVGRVRHQHLPPSPWSLVLGMVRDLATLRDRARDGIKKAVYRILSLGWTGPSDLGALRDRQPDPGWPGDAAGAVGALDREHGTSRRR